MKKPQTRRYLAQKKGRQRWCQRKKEEFRCGLARQIQDHLELGGWHGLFLAQSRLAQVKKDLLKADREMLASTSLGELIK